MKSRKSMMWYVRCLMILVVNVCLHANESFPTLSEAYKRALNYETKLKSVGYQVDAQKEDIKQAESQLYPQIYASFDNSNREYKDNFFHLKTKERYNSASITASQVLYRPEILSQIEGAKLRADSARIYLSKQEQELAYKVADAYISVLKYRNSVLVAESYVKTNFLRYQQIMEKLTLQLSNKMDLLESKLAYEQSKIILHKQEQMLALSKMKLKTLIGIDYDTIPIVSFDALDISPFLQFTPEQDLSGNPDIRMSHLSTQIYEKEVESSKYGHYPIVDLSLSHTKYETDDVSVDYEKDSRIVLSFKVPLYQGGKVDSQIEKSRLLLNAAREDLSDQRRTIKLKYEELRINYESALQDIILQKDAKSSATLYLYSVQKGYDHGLKNLIDLEDAKTKLYETQFKLIDAVYTLINTYVSILNITGNLTFHDIERLNNFITIND